MSYLIDTNIFIRCKNEMPMDIFQGFWQRLAELAQAGRIFSSVKVKEEIEKGNDDLKQWCSDHLPKSFFLPFDAFDKYAILMNWANSSPVFTVAAKQEFATGLRHRRGHGHEHGPPQPRRMLRRHLRLHRQP